MIVGGVGGFARVFSYARISYLCYCIEAVLTFDMVIENQDYSLTRKGLPPYNKPASCIPRGKVVIGTDRVLSISDIPMR